MSSIPVRARAYQNIQAAPVPIVQIPLSVRVVKRTIDILVASIGLAVAALLFPILALAIRLDSRGPILFRQRRAGALEGRTATGQPRFQCFDML
jgi:lipopolysaccharide/colanic/teichoic acid biosynthesis glycosyltransferase